MGDKEFGVSKKRSIFFTCIFDGTDKHAPDCTHCILNRICARFYGDFASFIAPTKKDRFLISLCVSLSSYITTYVHAGGLNVNNYVLHNKSVNVKVWRENIVDFSTSI